ncbi:MAG: proton-conducting transporter membrane subunit [Bacteroidales bacterium]
MGSLSSVGLLAGTIVLLASAALGPLVARRRQLAGTINAVASLAAGLAFGAVGATALASGPVAVRLPLAFTNVHLLVDGFSALFVVLISFMATVVSFYTIGYMEHYGQYGLRAFYLNFPVFVLGMVGIVIVDDLSWGFSIAWQLMTVSSFFLIRFDHHDPQIRRAAGKYLALMELAWLAIVAGATALSGSFAGQPLGELARMTAAAPAPLQVAALALVLVGFGLKAGVFPLGQLWLPDAHSSAPSPVSALLSGVMIKTGVYGIARTLFWMLPASTLSNGWRFAGLLVAAFGVASLFIGTVQALKQRDAKRLHAYSSIGQMGYILLGVGTAHFLSASSNPMLQALAVLALVAAIYHTFNHAAFKGLLFLVTGSVQFATGSKDMDKLGGLVRLMPVTAVVAAIAAASIAGVPASSGFASKWTLIVSDLLAGPQAPVLVLFGIVALFTSAITLACYVKFFGMTFTSAGSEWHAKPDVREVGATMLVPTVVLTAVCLAQGFFPWVFVNTICGALYRSEGASVSHLFSDPGLSSRMTALGAGLSISFDSPARVGAVMVPLLLLVVLCVALAFAGWLRRAGAAPVRHSAPWLCGYQQLSDANRYPSSNLFSAFNRAMRWTRADVHDGGTSARRAVHGVEEVL